jgi:CheY-like chemotaxis protein
MTFQLAGHGILVVENEALVTLDLVHVFERTGARVVSSNSVELALQLIEAEGWSAVVASALSEADSSRLCERLKRRNIPFILYTGLSLAAGACRGDLWAYRPAGPNMLVQAVEEFCKPRRTPGMHMPGASVALWGASVDYVG